MRAERACVAALAWIAMLTVTIGGGCGGKGGEERPSGNVAAGHALAAQTDQGKGAPAASRAIQPESLALAPAARTQPVEPPLGEARLPAIDAAAERAAKWLPVRAAAAGEPSASHGAAPAPGPTGGNRGATSASGNAAPAGEPPHDWEVRFARGNTLEEYAQQLDHFGVDLAVAWGNGEIIYLSRLTQSPPTKRVGAVREEMRPCFVWESGDLERADRELLARAQVDVGDGAVLKFFSPETMQTMEQLEKEYAGERADRVRKTRFGIHEQSGEYVFFVSDQWYR